MLRCVLGIAAVAYAAAVGVRNVLYSRGWLRAHRVDAVVISIGNITAGGTGKTPLVIWLCELLISNFKSEIADFKCAILTRGYKSGLQETENFKDEVVILAESCPEAKVIVNPDRVAAAEEAIVKFGANVLIMDDGFQHRRLARDLDIVAVDATEPFGYGRLLPAGLLREPVASLKRADAVVITRCDQVPKAEVDAMEKKLLAMNPDIVVARSIHAPVSVEYPEPLVIPANAGIQEEGEKVDFCLRRNDSIGQLKGRKVFAFCGIGNPDAFLSSIRNLGAKLAGSKVYDDHYHYTEHCLAEVRAEAEAAGADIILTTQKDWTKVSGLVRPGKGVPFAYLAIEMKFLNGQDRITSLIEKTLAGRMSQGG